MDAHRAWVEERYFHGWAKGCADEHVKIFRREDFAYHTVGVVFWQTDGSDRPTIVTEPYEKAFTAANNAVRKFKAAFADADEILSVEWTHRHYVADDEYIPFGEDIEAFPTHWRLRPRNFPPWQTVYHHCRQWTRNGLLARLNQRLRALVRRFLGQHGQPTAARLDRQTVRASAHGGAVGYDAARKTKGRQRFLLADTVGLLLGLTLEPANCPERYGARFLLATGLADYPPRRRLWVDGGFNGPDFAALGQTQHPKLVGKGSSGSPKSPASRCSPSVGSSSAPLAGGCTAVAWCTITNQPPRPPPVGFTSP